MVGQRTTPGLRDVRYRFVLDRQFVSRVELGERRLDVIEFLDFARALQLDPVELIATFQQAKP